MNITSRHFRNSSIDIKRLSSNYFLNRLSNCINSINRTRNFIHDLQAILGTLNLT